VAKRIRTIAIARDQAWSLPGHLQALVASASASAAQVDFHYIHYACSDPTPAILRRFAELTGARVTDGRVAAAEVAEPAAEMALRCRLLAEAIDAALADGCDGVLFLHPGVRLAPGTIDRLLASGRPLVGGVVCTDRAYDLPLAYREHNVYTVVEVPSGPGRFEAVLGGAEGLRPYAAVTQICLADREALRAGVAPMPHPQGEWLGMAWSAAIRGMPMWADGGARCAFAPGPEDLYFEPTRLSQALCSTGTLRLHRSGDRQVVILSATAIARSLQAALPALLVQAAPSLAGWPPASFHLDWRQQFARIEFSPPRR
jgi:hypothetical protein